MKNFKLKLSIKTGLKLDFTEIRNPYIKPDLNPKSGFESEIWIKTGFESEIWIKTGFESEIWIKTGFESEIWIKTGFESVSNLDFKRELNLFQILILNGI
jgi:hypothetical protein